MDVNKACPVIMVVNVMVGEVSMRRAAQLVRLANTACRYQRLKLPCFTIRRVLTIGTECWGSCPILRMQILMRVHVWREKHKVHMMWSATLDGVEFRFRECQVALVSLPNPTMW